MGESTGAPRRRGFGCGVRVVLALAIVGYALFRYFSQTEVNPVTGEKQHIALSVSEESALGIEAAPEMAAQMGGEVDPSDPDAIKALAAAETTLGGTLGRLFALAEAYPDLKANTNMIQLQEELTSTENKVAFARQAFNDAVLSYNNACQNFPGNLIANNFGFKTAQFLEIEQPEKRAVPKVSFS